VDTWSAFFATIHQDPVLQHVKLIAEPWDVGDDGYHAGHFPYHWSEWNDKFRESMRTFWLGGPQPLTDVATRLTGSADLFDNDGRPPSASINYLASHDGLTLADLAGADRRTVQNLLASLFLSMGTPMLMAGDEWGRSQKGCANAYDQDNEVSWLDWATADEVLRASVRRLIAVRPSVPWLRADRWPREDLEISWTREDGESLSPDDWQQPRTSIAMIGRDADGEAALLLNTAGDEVVYTLPPARTGAWRVVMSTACDGEGSRATSGDTVTVAGRSVVLAVGVKIDDT
jgi:glycogen operon protein